MRLVFFLLCVSLLAGCAGVDNHEKIVLRELEAVGAPCEKAAEPVAAAMLNILPGFGDIYLATGNGANGSNWGAFVLDFLFWPYSAVWAVPQGAITAGQVNQKECVAFYLHTSVGRAELARIRGEQPEEFTIAEKEVLSEIARERMDLQQQNEQITIQN